MTDNLSYPIKNSPPKSRWWPLLIAACLSVALLIPFTASPAATTTTTTAGGGEEDPPAPYDEIYVLVNVQGVGSIQIPAAIRNETVYLSVTDMFDFLKIKNVASPKMDSISGFFITQQATYLIDKINNRILYQGKTFTLKPDDMIRSEGNLYLRADYFGQIFELSCKFSFRSLSVNLSSRLELPVIREMRQELMRSNLSRLKGEVVADTIIPRHYPLFRAGMADWSVVTTQNAPGPDDTRLYLATGTVLAGGETNVAINYDNQIPFREREQFYQWRLVDNDNNILRQTTAGKIFTQSTSSIYFPVVGLQFTNTPTTFRRSFGSYTLSNYTEPNWVVELYVNSTLVDYAKADASGFFKFDVPLVYGNSVIKLRYYGPWGEQRSSEQNIQIPFNFLPWHQFEYTASAGVEEDSLHSRFGRANANYGLSNHLTAGVGVEYLSSVTSGRVMPFVNASLRVTPQLMVAGEYTHGVRSTFVANYHSPSDLQFEVDYTRYKKGQKAINNAYLEERKAIISVPLRNRHFSAFSRLTLYQIVLPSTKLNPSSKYTTIEELISGSILGAGTNFTTYALLADPTPTYIYSDLSLTFRLPGKFILTPEAQYEYKQQKFISIKAELGKYIFHNGYANIAYERNYKIGFKSIGAGLRFDLSFSQVGTTFRRSNGVNNTVQSLSGSLAYDDKLRHLAFSNRSNVGRGGIVLLPYLDLNNNGRWDKDEPKVAGLKVQINNGRIQYNKGGTSIRISELESYTSYIIHLNPDFENIAWRIHNQTLDVTIDPNQFKVLEIPVEVIGEVSGTVYLEDKKEQKPQGRIIVEFYREDRSVAARAMTEADGSFNYSGLTPGAYTARVSLAQLRKLHMGADPIAIPFTISEKKEGDIIDGLKFILRPLTGKIPDPDNVDN
jgi:hypothetical protein